MNGNNYKTRSVLALVTLLTLGLAGCAHQAGPRSAERDGYGQQPPRAETQYGHVRSIEQIEGRREGSAGRATSGGGAVVGGVIGGLLGNQVGKGDGRVAATMAGAVGGAVVGNEVERQNQRGQGFYYEIQVQMERRGGEQWFQLDKLDGIKIGDRVVIENGRLRRW